MTQVTGSDLFEKKLGELFAYWDDLPQVLVLDGHIFKKISQKKRIKILNALLMGILEQGETRRRHVLNALEIRDLIDENSEEGIEKANLYFHLTKLEKYGAIRVVDTLPIEGSKRAMSYYGRTAKMFVLAEADGKTAYPVLYTDEFMTLLLKLNPDNNRSEIQKILNKIDHINNFRHNNVLDWFAGNDLLLNQSNLNHPDLFDLISFIHRFNSPVFKGLKQIAELLKFDVK